MWIPSEENALADALSRFNHGAIADICAHWQPPFHPKLSKPCATLLWLGLAPATRLSYSTAVKSYEVFCLSNGLAPWPAQERVRAEWITVRTFANLCPSEGGIKAETILSYLSALRSVHVDRRMPTNAFNSPWIERIIKGARRAFPQKKTKRLPITKEILVKITTNDQQSVDELNCSMAFKVMWAGFLRMGEVTYKAYEQRDPSFTNIKPTRSDVHLSEDDQHAVLRLKRSKTDHTHTGVEILLAATGETTCPVQALRTLITRDPQPLNAPLFKLENRPFSRENVVIVLRERLRSNLISVEGYSGHSFRKGAAQHASDHGLLDEQIQTLGRWTSQAFKVYFTASTSTRYSLSKRFQTGRPPIVSA